MFLLSASKSGNTFTIYSDSNYSSVIGKVVSNFLGTEYTIYKSNEQVAAILYETNVFGLKGPRKMTIILPPVQESCHDLLKKYKEDSEQLVVLHNKPPMWNEESDSFVLNFEGRVTLASVKNFQIVPDLDIDYIALQFGKIGPDTFTLDVKYPFSPLVAFGVAISSIDGKMGCE